MGGFWNYAEDRDEDSTACYEEGAEDHPEGKYIAEDEAGKKCVP